MFLLLSGAALILIVIFLRILLTYGFYKHFIYTDKRESCVSIHMSACKTPRNPMKMRYVVSSLGDLMNELHNKGYECIYMRSHLINKKNIKTVKKLIKKNGFTFIKKKVHKTSLKDKIFIPISIFIFKCKMVKVNNKSYSITVSIKDKIIKKQNAETEEFTKEKVTPPV